MQQDISSANGVRVNVFSWALDEGHEKVELLKLRGGVAKIFLVSRPGITEMTSWETMDASYPQPELGTMQSTQPYPWLPHGVYNMY